MRFSRAYTMRIAGYSAFGLTSLSGLMLGLNIAYATAGVAGMLVASALFPMTVALSPWYALLELSDWTPMLVVYGGAVLSVLLVRLSDRRADGATS
jgi:hypothetical protein